MVASTTRAVVNPTVAEVALEATTSSRVAAAGAAPRAAGRPTTLIPSRPEFAHDMSMNGTTE